MADIGLKSGKIKPGKYRCGKFQIIKSDSGEWMIVLRDEVLRICNTMSDAYYKARYSDEFRNMI